jgi:hypothetical protein
MSPIAATRPAATMMLMPVTLDGRILNHLLGDLAVEKLDILGEPVELAQVPLDGGLLVNWQFLSSKPTSAQPTKQLGMRARRDEMRLQDGMHVVLDPRPMPNREIGRDTQEGRLWTKREMGLGAGRRCHGAKAGRGQPGGWIHRRPRQENGSGC